MTLENALAVRQQLAGDWQRPHYHFLPPSNWMNDPNGLIQWRGTYHLFYQYNPTGALWGNIHWGHASSVDLVHWTDLPIALAPTPNSADETGCFSGCAVDNGLPTIVYTSTRGTHYEMQTQSMATSSDDMLTWEKYAGNPVLANVPAEANQTNDFRDPFVWKEADAWYMVLGSRIKDVGGTVFLYRSANLTEWEYLNPLLVAENPAEVATWECPNFFKLGENWVLIISEDTKATTSRVLYFVGSYENYRFTPSHKEPMVLDYERMYAPLTFLDEQNRRILIGWIREARSNDEQEKASWSGVQTIPRVLALDPQKHLLMLPVPELEAIRGEYHHYESIELSEEISLDVRGLALDIEAEFRLDAGGNCGISLGCSGDGSERTDIVYDSAKEQLMVRSGSAKKDDQSSTSAHNVKHTLAPRETLKLRILLDGSVLEIIANDRTSLTHRLYPMKADSDGVKLVGTKAHLQTLDIWEMPSIW